MPGHSWGITAGGSQLKGITGSFEGGNACLGKAGGSQLGGHSWGITAGGDQW